jgi:steroid delta-isomerase-like uncharacterized protein
MRTIYGIGCGPNMGAKENLRVIENEITAFNARDWDAYLGCFTDSVVTYEPDESEPIRGREALRNRVSSYLAAFPDVHLQKERLFGDEQWVCLNSVFMGTHQGNLPGPGGITIKPTGRKVNVHGCSVFRLKGGLITEFIGYYDQIELLSQLGMSVKAASR